MKLFYVVLDSLSPGRKQAQLIHACDSFREEHPEVHNHWKSKSNVVIVYQADAEKLRSIYNTAQGMGHKVSAFFEPDYKDTGSNDLLTAIVLEPSAKKLVVGKLPLSRLLSFTWLIVSHGKAKAEPG